MFFFFWVCLLWSQLPSHILLIAPFILRFPVAAPHTAQKTTSGRLCKVFECESCDCYFFSLSLSLITFSTVHRVRDSYDKWWGGKKSFWTPPAFVMCDVLSLRVRFDPVQSANLGPTTARKLFRPAYNWVFQRDDFVPRCNTSRKQELQECSFFVILSPFVCVSLMQMNVLKYANKKNLANIYWQ